MPDRIIEFFKSMDLYNEEYFNYLWSNTKIINKPYEDIMDFVGCYKVDDGCKLILPKISSYKDELIYVHEYTHALFLDDELEIFPNLMEAYYINKYFDNNLKLEIIEKENIKSLDLNHKIGKINKMNNMEVNMKRKLDLDEEIYNIQNNTIKNYVDEDKIKGRAIMRYKTGINDYCASYDPFGLCEVMECLYCDNCYHKIDLDNDAISNCDTDLSIFANADDIYEILFFDYVPNIDDLYSYLFTDDSQYRIVRLEDNVKNKQYKKINII